MAAETKQRRRRGRTTEPTTPATPRLRVLTASATRLDLADKKQTRRQRTLRQGWQIEAWAYRDAIPELRYALNYLARSASRMRYFPAARPADGQTGTPEDLRKAGAPQSIIDACNRAMKDLGNGRLDFSEISYNLSTNLSVAGECYLLGRIDPLTGRDRWSIRSIDEIVVYDDQWMLREIPLDPSGQLGWERLDPETSVVTRLWLGHPRFQILADSACRSIVDECEGLLILRRMIRATGRSRLAGRGLLFIPNEMTLETQSDDNGDVEADDFMSELSAVMIEPISDEGVASAVVPIVIRGPGDQIANVRWEDFAASFDEMSIKNRAELVGVIATGLDLPKEIIEGMADLNHWTAYQVDDSTFRYHIEPHVQDLVGCMTEGYLSSALAADAILQSDPDWPAWKDRICVWYDPVDLVTHPDQTQDAFALHDRIAISDEALRRVAGFQDSDKPSQKEKEERMIRNQRTWPANVSLAIIGENDPTLEIPPIEQSGTVPGLEGGKVQGVPLPPAPIAEPDLGTPAPNGTPEQAGTPVPPPAQPEKRPEVKKPGGPGGPTPPPVVAAGKPQPSKKAIRLSRRLGEIDRDLRARLQIAANAAMMRRLEKAGGRLRQRVGKDEALRTKIAMTKNERVGAVLGQETVESTGLTAAGLMGSDWTDFQAQFDTWTKAAQEQALSTAAQMAGIAEGDAALEVARRTMAAGRASAWDLLESALTQLGHHLLYNPDPNAADVAETIAAFNPDTVVPAGVIRAALGIAGGLSEHDFGMLPTQSGAMVPAQPLGVEFGQVATGPTITDLLQTAGLEQAQYEWVHGPALNPFEPHEALDGVEFQSFDDADLANPDSFPDNAFFFPGDHAGCTCDTIPLWVTAEDLASVGVYSDEG